MADLSNGAAPWANLPPIPPSPAMQDFGTEITRQAQAQQDALNHQRAQDFLARYPQSPDTLDALAANPALKGYVPSDLPWHKDVYAADQHRAVNAGPYGALSALASSMFPSPGTPEHDRAALYMRQQDRYDRADHFPLSAVDVLHAIMQGKTPEQLLEERNHDQKQAAIPHTQAQQPPTSPPLASSPVPPPPTPVSEGNRPHSNGTVYGSPIVDAAIQQATGVDTSAAAAARQALAERSNFDAVLNSPLYRQQVEELTRHGLDEVTAGQIARMRAFQANGLEGAYLRSPVSANDYAGYEQEGDRERNDMAATGDPRHVVLDTGTFARDRAGNISHIARDGTNSVYPAGVAPSPATPFGASMLNAQRAAYARVQAAQTLAEQRRYSAIYSTAARLAGNPNPEVATLGQNMLQAVTAPSASYGPAPDYSGMGGYDPNGGY